MELMEIPELSDFYLEGRNQQNHLLRRALPCGSACPICGLRLFSLPAWVIPYPELTLVKKYKDTYSDCITNWIKSVVRQEIRKICANAPDLKPRTQTEISLIIEFRTCWRFR